MGSVFPAPPGAAPSPEAAGHSAGREPESPGRFPREAWWACAIVILVGAVVRLIPCFNDFWLDEVWSYFAIRELTSPADVFTAIHHSNNHHLYSLLMYWIGDTPNWVWYRVPSFLAGVGIMVLVARILSSEGRWEAVIGSILTASSFLLIQFSSEARGYALAVFFALSAYIALVHNLERPGWRSVVLFGGSIVLGVLSQLIYLFFYAGVVVWSLLELLRRERPKVVPRLLVLHIGPVAALLLLYLVDVRRMEVGSGDGTPLNQLLATTIGATFGLPWLPVLGWIYAVLGAVGLALGLLALHRRHPARSWAYLVAILVAPVTILLITRPAVISPRYFVIGMTLWLMLSARLLGGLVAQGGLARGAAWLLVGLFVAGNLFPITSFFKLGRGGYRDAVLYIAEHTQGSQMVLGFDHDFRTGIVARFYARYLPAGKELLYFPMGEWPAEGPEWIITHSAARPDTPAPAIADSHGNSFRLEAEYDYAGLSGFYWGVYHNLRKIAP